MAKKLMLKVFDENKNEFVRTKESSERGDIMLAISGVVMDDRFILQDIDKMETAVTIVYIVTGKYVR